MLQMTASREAEGILRAGLDRMLIEWPTCRCGVAAHLRHIYLPEEGSPVRGRVSFSWRCGAETSACDFLAPGNLDHFPHDLFALLDALPENQVRSL